MLVSNRRRRAILRLGRGPGSLPTLACRILPAGARKWDAQRGVLLLALVAGCQQPLQRELVAQRATSLACALTLLEQREAERPAEFRNTLELLAEQHAQDVAVARRIPGRLQAALEAECRHWETGEGARRERFEELMAGQPESFARDLSRICN